MSLHLDSTGGIRELDPAHARRLAGLSEEAGPDRWKLRCPECGGSAFSAGNDLLCPAEGRRLQGFSGVLPLMRPERIAVLGPFLEAYRRVRRIEGWGGPADYYRRLPFDSTGRHRSLWRIRARSYRAALRAIASRYPRMKKADEWDKLALRVLELGAGNGWFSWRMAEAGHYVLATDISLDEEDGLVAVSRYARGALAGNRLTLARAEMEDLPLDEGQFDVVVANGSIHYAGHLSGAIAEARRLLREAGLFLVLDSPVYDDAAAGREMVRRRMKHHQEDLGVVESPMTTGFLVGSDFASMLEQHGFRVEVSRPFEGWQRRLRRAYCRWRGIQAPARFPLFVAEKR